MVQTIKVVLLVFGLVHGSEWTYDNQDEWPGVCATGQRQSPIDITSTSISDTSFVPFIFTNYNKDYYAHVTNNGHTVKIVLDGADVPTVRGGGLPNEFALDSVHFHWSSEHKVNGHRYSAELHAVHYDTRYGNADNATNYLNGLAVLAVLFEISPDDDTYFDSVMEVIEEVQNIPGETVRLNNSVRADIFFPRDTSGFFRYFGSLTTPNCDEVVIWTIFTNTLHVSRAQVAHFTSMWSREGPLTTNYRSIQPLNSRKIYGKMSPIPRIVTSNTDDAFAKKASISVIFSAVLLVILSTKI